MNEFIIRKGFISQADSIVGGNISSDAFVTSGGTSSQFVKGDGTLDSNNYELSGHTHITGIEVSQTSHGFIVGDAVKNNGTIWVKAIADSPANSDVLGLVSENVDTNNFIVQSEGLFTGGTWTKGLSYFLSPTVSGAVITEPSYIIGDVRQYIGVGVDGGLLLEIDLGDEFVLDLDNYTESINVNGAYNINWFYDTYNLTLNGDTTLTDANQPTSGVYSKAITVYVSGNHALTLPVAWQTYVTGAYDGTALNQIVCEYIKSGLYWVNINRAD